MGSFIEINDTLRISKKQGFPTELSIEEHIKNPYKLEYLEDKVFAFNSKSKIRVYKIPPVRNLLVEDIDGKWIYWGLCHILEIYHNYQKQETSGKFKVIRLNSPNEMKEVFELIHFGGDEENYF